MGPGDPFATDTYEDDNDDGRYEEPARPRAYSEVPDYASKRESKAVAPLNAFLALGLLSGLLFGLVVVFSGLFDALVITVFGLLGLGLAWTIWAVLNQALDLRGALRALLKR